MNSSAHEALSDLGTQLETVGAQLRSELLSSENKEQRNYLEDYEPLTHPDAWPVDYDEAAIIESFQKPPSETKNVLGPIANCIVRVMKG